MRAERRVYHLKTTYAVPLSSDWVDHLGIRKGSTVTLEDGRDENGPYIKVRNRNDDRGA